MTTYEQGTSYEDLVARTYAAILQAEERDGRVRHVDLEVRKQITGAGGNSNEIDIYWEYEIAGVVYKTAIECKAYSTGNVPVSDVRDFAYKLRDIGGIKGLMVTLNGFASGAKTVAENESIDLLTIREYRDGDLEGYLNQINLNMTFRSPARCVNFVPCFDGEWMIARGFEEGNKISWQCRNDQLILEDKGDGFRKSLLQLETERFGSDSEGTGVWEREFLEGWLNVAETVYKIRSVKVEYVIPRDHTQTMEIDFTAHVVAVLKYLDKEATGGNRFAVYDNGTLAPLNAEDESE